MAELIKQNDGIIDFDILINGQKVKDTVEVQEIYIEMEVNRITYSRWWCNRCYQ